MSKEVKFNVNLSVNDKDVVVQCKSDVEKLDKALGTIPDKAEQGRHAMIKWSAVSTIYNNLYSGLQQLATFATQRSTLEPLLLAMNKLVVQQKKKLRR